MGKNRVRESLIRKIVNTIVHRILIVYTNNPKSKSSINSEIIEYPGQARKTYEEYNWNKEDIKYIKEKSIKKIKEKLKIKYSDIKYNKKDIEKFLNEEVKELET